MKQWLIAVAGVGLLGCATLPPAIDALELRVGDAKKYDVVQIRRAAS
jgi:uncharacterized lipoprotein YmbA